jgi:hypothetical protein
MVEVEPNPSAWQSLAMRTSDWERDQILGYFEAQDFGTVIHLEKVASERAGGVSHDIWDVHCTDSRWWAVTNPLNAYSQEDFKSRDVVLTFHVGLTLRIAEQRHPPISDTAASLLPGSWRRWEQAVDALSSAQEAEDFQAVGVRLRECLVSFAAEVSGDDLVPEGDPAPKGADVVSWTNLLIDTLAAGSGARQLRSYLKKLVRETWDYVNWLTHAKNARHHDAEFGIAAVSHFLACCTAARLRWTAEGHRRCDQCGSYALATDQCQRCGWIDTDYEPPPREQLSKEEVEARLAEPCTPSSDISTLITVDDATRPNRD